MWRSSDIVVRTDRKDRETVWVSERILLIVCGGLTDNYLRKVRSVYFQTVSPTRRNQKFLPDTETSWRYAQLPEGHYYDYERIPDKAPARYRSTLGSVESIKERARTDAKTEQTKALDAVIADACEYGWREWMQAYEGIRQGESLSRGAAVLSALVAYIYEQSLDARKLSVFVEAGEMIERCKVPYLPANGRRLQEKVRRVMDGETVPEVVFLPRTGNSNAVKVDDPQIIAWVTVMRASGANYSNAHIARKVVEMCLIQGKISPSKSWTEHYLSREVVKQLTGEVRYKGGRKMMNYTGYIPQEGAVFAGDCWLMDATRVNFIEFTEGHNKWEHLMVCMVYDVHSGAMLARVYGRAEDRWMYSKALNIAGMKAGYLPYEIVTDRFPGYNTQEWEDVKNKLQGDSVKLHETWKMTGKARLERAIDTVQMVAMQHSDKYYGQGMMSGRDYAHRSEETLTAMRQRARNEGWNMQKAIEEAEKTFERYNHTKYSEYSRKYKGLDKSPMEIHTESAKPHVKKMEAYELLHYFGLRKEIQVTRQGMIVTDIQNVRYVYVIDPKHYDVIKHHRKVVMYYDLEDLDTVQIYSVEKEARLENFLCEATEQKAVQWCGPSQDKEAMGKAKKRLADWGKKQKEELQQHFDVLGVSASDVALIGSSSTKEQRERAETAALLQRAKPVAVRTARQVTEDDDDDAVLTLTSTNAIRDLY